MSISRYLGRMCTVMWTRVNYSWYVVFVVWVDLFVYIKCVNVEFSLYRLVLNPIPRCISGCIFTAHKSPFLVSLVMFHREQFFRVEIIRLFCIFIIWFLYRKLLCLRLPPGLISLCIKFPMIWRKFNILK